MLQLYLVDQFRYRMAILFSNANDRQKIFAFIRRCIRAGFCSPDLADFHDLYISSDEKLFNTILTCPNHILRTLMPLTYCTKLQS